MREATCILRQNISVKKQWDVLEYSCGYFYVSGIIENKILPTFLMRGQSNYLSNASVLGFRKITDKDKKINHTKEKTDNPQKTSTAILIV